MAIRRNALAATVVLALAVGAAQAAAPKVDVQARATALKALSDCRRETDTAVRLACYDKAAATLDEAETSGQIVVLDREQVRTARRQAFGLDLSSINLFRRTPGAPKEDRVDHVALTVARAGRNGDGRWRLTTEEGPTWVQTDSEEIALEPHAGSKLTVSSGLLGAFFCKVDGQASVRCMRQN